MQFIFDLLCVENVLVRTGISHTLEWKRSQKGHVSTLKSSRNIYKLECETDSDAGYYAGAVEIILTCHGESLRSKFAGN